jgi:hypothetical protein
MQTVATEWLAAPAQELFVDSPALNPSTNGLPFQRQLNSRRHRGERVPQPDRRDHRFPSRDGESTECQSRAESLVEQAGEYLKIAHERVQSAELARCAAEDELTRYHDQIENRIDTMVRDLREQTEQVASRLAVAEAQLAIAERRAALAEDRANKAEATIRRLEGAIRTQALSKNLNLLLSAV